MKRKLLFVCAMLLGLSSWAQTDVTSTYLNNAGFDASSSFATSNVGFNPADKRNVEGWTTGGSNDWCGAAAFEFGTEVKINNRTIPSTNSDGVKEGGCMAFGGSWDNGSGYIQYTQSVTLPAGTYTLVFKIYNINENQNFRQNLFGFKTSSKTYYGSNTSFPQNSWKEEKVVVVLDEETTGDISVGFGWNSASSNNTPHLAVDYVQILKTKSLQELMDEATEANPSDVTSFYLKDAAVTSATAWTNGRINSGQQYTGAPDNTYLDSWNATFDQKQVVKLKAGKYTLKAATRADATIQTANIYANIKNGAKQNKAITAVGNTGGELGNGWGWTTVDFLVTVDDSEVTIGFYSQCDGNKWAGADDFSLLYDRKIQESDLLPAAKAELKAAIEGHAVPTTNVSEAFAFDWNKTSVENNKSVLDAAQAVLDNETATLAEINEQTEKVNALTAPSLNAPAADMPYNIVLKYAGWDYDNCAITSMNNRPDHGGYNLQYRPQDQSWTGENYKFISATSQAMYFTAVEGGYKVNFIDVEGKKRYISTGVPYGGNTAQIRTTDDETKALVIDVRRNGAHVQLWNTAANQYIGSQDAGVYTVNNHIDYDVTAATVIRKTDNEAYGTICLPFAAKAEGAEVFTLAGKKTSGETVTGLVFEQAEESDVLEAGVPYLYRATAEAQTFTYTEGQVVAEPKDKDNGFYGTFTRMELEYGKYFLYTQDNTFYPADTDVFVGANKCYIEMDKVAEYQQAQNSRTVVFGIEGDDATGITGIENAVELSKDGKFLQNGQIIIVKDGKKFNVAGQKLK